MSAIDINSKFQSAQRPIADLSVGRIRRPVWGKYLKKPARLDVATLVTTKLLNRVQDRLTASLEDVGWAMRDLLSTLSAIKFGVTPEVWEQVAFQCLRHPIHNLINEDPFTARSFRKPRGYPGDAVLIDFIYTRDAHFGSDEAVSELGERIFEFTRDTPPCRAVRARRDIMGTIIDSVSDQVSRPCILSVACGHLREAMLSR